MDIARFVHEELSRRCIRAVELIPEQWRENKRIYPTLLMWPADSVRATDGSDFSGVVFTDLPEDSGQRRVAVIRAAKRCDAYGLLLTEQIDGFVRLVFETEHGTRTWRFPIKPHGNIQILGRPAFRDNAESIGIRWHAN